MSTERNTTAEPKKTDSISHLLLMISIRVKNQLTSTLFSPRRAGSISARVKAATAQLMSAIPTFTLLRKQSTLKTGRRDTMLPTCRLPAAWALRSRAGSPVRARKISDENGHVISGPYTKYAADGTTPLYTIKNGRLYVFKEVDADEGIRLYAHWEEIRQTTLQVIIWRQKISDSKNAYDYEKTYDFEASYNIDSTSGMTLSDLRANNVLGTYEGYNFTGFHYRTTEMSTAAVRGDGGTVVNVYYDRDLMTIYFYFSGSGGQQAYTYTATTNNTPETQYGIVEGQYVQLVRRQGSGTKYTFRYDYQRTNSDTITPQYALVTKNDVRMYVELTREVQTVSNTRWQFRTGNGLTKTTRYMDQGKTDGIFYVKSGKDYTPSGFTTSNPPDNTDTKFYCKYNNRYYELTPQTTTTTTYVWKNGEVEWTGERFRRLAGSKEYTGERYSSIQGFIFSNLRRCCIPN